MAAPGNTGSAGSLANTTTSSPVPPTRSTLHPLHDHEFYLYIHWSTIGRFDDDVLEAQLAWLPSVGLPDIRQQVAAITEDQIRRFKLYEEKKKIQIALYEAQHLKIKLGGMHKVFKAEEEDALAICGGWDEIRKEDKLAKNRGQG